MPRARTEKKMGFMWRLREKPFQPCLTNIVTPARHLTNIVKAAAEKNLAVARLQHNTCIKSLYFQQQIKNKKKTTAVGTGHATIGSEKNTKHKAFQSVLNQ